MSTDDRPNSMFARAIQDASDETGGRFARNTDVSVAGTSPIPHADKLAGPQWSADIGTIEPPLGYAIDELPSLETVSGIDRAEAIAIDAANAAAATDTTNLEE
jgi:hypothetical protein